MIVITINGFNVRDRGKATTGRLRPMLEAMGFTVIEYHYGWASLRDVYFAMDNIVEGLVSMVHAIREPFHLIGHSNGCALGHRLTFYDTKLQKMVYFSPALNVDEIPGQYQHGIQVFHTRSDWAVRLSSYLPFLLWGRMGANGPRYETLYRGGVIDGYPVVKRHSDWFLDRGLVFSEPFLKSHLGEPCDRFVL